MSCVDTQSYYAISISQVLWPGHIHSAVQPARHGPANEAGPESGYGRSIHRILHIPLEYRVFVDGKLAGKSRPGLQLTEGKPDVCIGSFRDGLVYGFMGKMDDVSIYDRALSLDEMSRRAKGID